MTKQDRGTLTWVEIDPQSLGKEQGEAYLIYKEAYGAMRVLRQVFENKMQEMAPEGKRLVIGYNFGKLSVAVTEAEVVKAKPLGKQSLGDYLKGMQNSGRRV